MRKHLFIFLLVSFLAASAMLAQKADSPAPAISDRVALPPAMREGGISLNEALAKRQSIREYSGQPLSQKELAQLLWAAQGVNRPNGHRTAPSANALYPLELYAVTPNGTFHYMPGEHQLERVSAKDLRPEVAKAARGQRQVLQSGAVFIFTAVFERMEKRYGEAQRVRSTNFVYAEAGHAAQNLLLEAAALNLGSVPMGGFDEVQMSELLPIPKERVPIYVVAVGRLPGK